MFEVIAPSKAFSVDASGRGSPSGHNVKYPKCAYWDDGGVKHIGLCGCRYAARTAHNIHRELAIECA